MKPGLTLAVNEMTENALSGQSKTACTGVQDSDLQLSPSISSAHTSSPHAAVPRAATGRDPMFFWEPFDSPVHVQQIEYFSGRRPANDLTLSDPPASAASTMPNMCSQMELSATPEASPSVTFSETTALRPSSPGWKQSGFLRRYSHGLDFAQDGNPHNIEPGPPNAPGLLRADGSELPLGTSNTDHDAEERTLNVDSNDETDRPERTEQASGDDELLAHTVSYSF